LLAITTQQEFGVWDLDISHSSVRNQHNIIAPYLPASNELDPGSPLGFLKSGKLFEFKQAKDPFR
jgi:hypothetical protein